MGNSQVSNSKTAAAALIIQYPSGKSKRMDCSVTAGEVMQLNPGHFISLIMQINPGHNNKNSGNDDSMVVNFTHVKLLRPHESLVLGNAYRLLTTEEVMKVMRAKKYGKMKNNEGIKTAKRLQIEKQGLIHVEDQETKFAAARSKSWRPSLHSISEAGW